MYLPQLLKEERTESTYQVSFWAWWSINAWDSLHEKIRETNIGHHHIQKKCQNIRYFFFEIHTGCPGSPGVPLGPNNPRGPCGKNVA